MTDSRIYGAIGLSMKAGKCVSGEFAVETALKKGVVKLLILDSDTSELTKKKFSDASVFRSVKMVYLKNVGTAIGKPERKLLAITDSGFSDMILKAMEKDTNN